MVNLTPELKRSAADDRGGIGGGIENVNQLGARYRRSMTALAAGSGSALGHSWTWELRSVNGKGRDLRMRLPDWLPGLEQTLRGEISAVVARGNVTCGLRVGRDGSDNADTQRLEATIEAVQVAQRLAAEKGLDLAPLTAGDLISLRPPVQDVPLTEEELKELCAAIAASLPEVLSAFDAMRAGEGAAIFQILMDQLDQMEALVADATRVATERTNEAASAFRAALDKIAGQIGEVEPDRVAQELALLAVKADVTEELDRLTAHIAAARALLAEQGAVGRKLDFLCQEFNREANTLCSKSQSVALTRIGLDLKALIDQLREQVQNLE